MIDRSIYLPLHTLRGMGIDKAIVSLGGRGIANAIGLARDFVQDEAFCAILGDNILRGDPLADVRHATFGSRPSPTPNVPRVVVPVGHPVVRSVQLRNGVPDRAVSIVACRALAWGRVELLNRP